MTTAILESGIRTSACFDFRDELTTSETSSAPFVDRPVKGTAGVRAWPMATSEPEITSETASFVDDEADPEEESTQEATDPVRVLIVDDESAMCLMTSVIVESMGFVPITVASGEEAIEAYRQHQDRDESIQVVIMDLALPGGMSGLEATDVLREIDEGARVIASSGYLQQNARTAAIERGFAGILPKPYTAKRLTAELRWVVTHR